MRTSVFIPGSMILAMAAVSCRTQVEEVVNPRPGVEVQSAKSHVPQFRDIPTPNGFALENENLESYVQEAGLWRNGKLLYVGRGSARDAIAYYEERLPEHGWTLTDRNTNGSRSQLEWKKGDTMAKIEMVPAGKDDLLRLTVSVSTPRVASEVDASGKK